MSGPRSKASTGIIADLLNSVTTYEKPPREDKYIEFDFSDLHEEDAANRMVPIIEDIFASFHKIDEEQKLLQSSLPKTTLTQKMIDKLENKIGDKLILHQDIIESALDHIQGALTQLKQEQFKLKFNFDKTHTEIIIQNVIEKFQYYQRNYSLRDENPAVVVEKPKPVELSFEKVEPLPAASKFSTLGTQLSIKRAEASIDELISSAKTIEDSEIQDSMLMCYEKLQKEIQIWKRDLRRNSQTSEQVETNLRQTVVPIKNLDHLAHDVLSKLPHNEKVETSFVHDVRAAIKREYKDWSDSSSSISSNQNPFIDLYEKLDILTTAENTPTSLISTGIKEILDSEWNKDIFNEYQKEADNSDKNQNFRFKYSG